MKILVTGASGYLGSHFIKTFQDQPHSRPFHYKKTVLRVSILMPYQP